MEEHTSWPLPVEGLGQVADRRDDILGLDIEEDRLPKSIVSPGRKRKRL